LHLVRLAYLTIRVFNNTKITTCKKHASIHVTGNTMITLQLFLDKVTTENI